MAKTEKQWKRANVVYTGGKSYTIGGKKFVQNELTIPSHVLLYNSQCYGFSEEQTDIVASLGKKFDYQELMRS